MGGISFPQLFFSGDDSALATLQSLATFSIAFYHDH
jgi:hypothetical protein